MEMSEDFYASIKLKTGEEIVAKVCPCGDGENLSLLLSNPCTIAEVKGRSADTSGYQMEPWIKSSSNNMYLIGMEDVMTMCENTDIEMIIYYEEWIRKSNRENYSNGNLNKNMGYLGTIEDAKKRLEKLYNEVKEKGSEES